MEKQSKKVKVVCLFKKSPSKRIFQSLSVIFGKDITERTQREMKLWDSYINNGILEADFVISNHQMAA